MPRFKITDNERSVLDNLIVDKSPVALHPNTRSRIISVIHHLTKSLDKDLAELTVEDVEQFIQNSHYSKSTCMWINNILSKYLNLQSRTVTTNLGYTKSWLTEDILNSTLQNMLQDVENGHPELSSILIIVISVLCCQRIHRTRQLSIRQIMQILNKEIVVNNNFIFYILPHITLEQNGEPISDILFRILGVILERDPDYVLQPQSISFLKNNLTHNVRGAGYTEFYKFSRRKLLAHLANSTKQEIARKIEEIEKNGFACLREYFEYLFQHL